jgi:hypothetical protein
MEHIDILFKEYDTLRQEVISRTTNGYQMAAMVAALGAALLSWIIIGKPPSWLWILIVISTTTVLVTTAFGLHGEINWLDARLCELEEQINTIAGKRLLIWETCWIKDQRKPWHMFKKLKV